MLVAFIFIQSTLLWAADYAWVNPLGVDHPTFHIPFVSRQFCEQESEKMITVILKKQISAISHSELKKKANCLLPEPYLHPISEESVSIDGSNDIPAEGPVFETPEPITKNDIGVLGIAQVMRSFAINSFPATSPGRNQLPVSLKIQCEKNPIQAVLETKSEEKINTVFIDLAIEKAACALLPKQWSFNEQNQRQIAQESLDKWSNENTKIAPTDNKYRELRLKAYLYAYLKRSTGSLDLKQFCSEYEKKQEKDADYAKRFGILRFRNATEWRYAFAHGLTEADITAIRSYSENFYKWVNRELREPKDLDKIQSFQDVIVPALERLPTFKGDVIRYAELPEKVLEEHKAGSIVTYPAFTSTSKRMDFTWSQSTSTHKFLIHLKKRGREITPLSAHLTEEEILVLPGTKFRILSRTPMKTGETAELIEMEEVEYATSLP